MAKSRFSVYAFFKRLDGSVFDTAKDLRKLMNEYIVKHRSELPPDYQAQDMFESGRQNRYLRENYKGQLYICMKE